MRILITASRTWTEVGLILRGILDLQVQNEPITIVHGACPQGGDRIADQLARNHGWSIEAHPAEWAKYGKRAGFLRNDKMVKLGADHCLAFIKDGSPGATMCANLAQRAGIPTTRIIR